ncbi:WD40 repeat domain-containing protein [Candidatus Poriferisodalis multihospitum]|uniref:WD40 repeat domain-containing protein n=1 Tax=Candidatus Poriferisodalis multihospitum TaxID=2983191 RepID=UPI002B2600FD|nr:WD40 repeat domain-containing protein [Candidatus Poriferisodalis multihospitum]
MTDAATSPIAQWRVDVDDYVQVLEVYRDRGQAVVGSLGGDAALIEVDDGSATALERHEMGVLSAAWSSDGSRVAVGGQDGCVRIYDRTGAAQGVVDTSAWVTALAWSPNAPVLAIGAGRHLLITDLDGALLHDFDDQPSTVTAVAWSADGSRVGATAYGGIGWHDVVGPRTGRRRRFDWKGSLLSLAMSPDGAWACAGAQDATVHLWRLWSGKDLSMSGYPSKIERIRFRHDSRWLAVACLGELTVWDFGGKGPAGTAPASASGHDNHIEDLDWDPSGKSVATGGGDGRTIVWAAPTRAGQDLSPVTALESDEATSRLRWVSEDCLLVGRADGGLVKLAL